LKIKVARRDAISNVKCFGAPELQRSNFDGCVYYIHHAAPPYSARISSIYQLVLLRLLTSDRVQRLAPKQNAEYT